MFAGPAGTSGNLSLGGYDPLHDRLYVMYVFSGGGYGGNEGSDGLTNGTSPVGISKTQPVEILEAQYPVLFEEYGLRENSAGAGWHRGGFGVTYRMKLRRGAAKASFMMDHGKTSPYGFAGGLGGAMNEIELCLDGVLSRPKHVSKGQSVPLGPGDWVQVRTPGGGGYGDPRKRERALVERDVRRGYIGMEPATTRYGRIEASSLDEGGNQNDVS